MALIWPARPPAGPGLDYEVDWLSWLDGDIISTSVFAFANDAQNVPIDGGCTIDSQSNTDTTSTVWISGGTAGLTAELLCTITTQAGRTTDVAIFLPVVDPALAQPSTATKGTLVNMALEEIGLAPYEFDFSAQEQASALRRLDALMIEWETEGLALNYNYPPAIGQSQPTDAAGIDDRAVNAAIQQLALRLAPAIGKTISSESKLAYSQSLNALRAMYAVIPSRCLQRGTPIGIGNKPWSVWRPFGQRGP